jgi:hypothetical protein
MDTVQEGELCSAGEARSIVLPVRRQPGPLEDYWLSFAAPGRRQYTNIHDD